MRKSTVISSDRFERVRESGRKERYIDRWTGEQVSRRFATQATTGMKIEERQANLRFEKHKIDLAEIRRPRHDKIGLPLLESYLKDRGEAVRGEKATMFQEVKADLKEIKAENPDHWRSMWIDYLYDVYGKDYFKGFDFHAFFGSPTTE